MGGKPQRIIPAKKKQSQVGTEKPNLHSAPWRTQTRVPRGWRWGKTSLRHPDFPDMIIKTGYFNTQLYFMVLITVLLGYLKQGIPRLQFKHYISLIISKIIFPEKCSRNELTRNNKYSLASSSMVLIKSLSKCQSPAVFQSFNCCKKFVYYFDCRFTLWPLLGLPHME